VTNIIKQDKQNLGKKSGLSKVKILVVSVVLLLLLAGGVTFGWFYMNSQQPAQIVTAPLSEDKFDQVLVDAQTLVASGDTSGASAIYDKAASETSDSYQKSILILSKATIYLNNKDYDQALVIAKEAELVNQNSVVTRVIAQLYEEKGDKKNAIEYYQKTIDLIDMDDPMAGDDIEYYKSIITDLGGVAK